jgi:hypothetical protein
MVGKISFGTGYTASGLVTKDLKNARPAGLYTSGRTLTNHPKHAAKTRKKTTFILHSLPYSGTNYTLKQGGKAPQLN